MIDGVPSTPHREGNSAQRRAYPQAITPDARLQPVALELSSLGGVDTPRLPPRLLPFAKAQQSQPASPFGVASAGRVGRDVRTSTRLKRSLWLRANFLVRFTSFFLRIRGVGAICMPARLQPAGQSDMQCKNASRRTRQPGSRANSVPPWTCARRVRYDDGIYPAARHR